MRSDPVQIILFGSQARGEGQEESDLDFLLVQDPPFTGENARRKQMAKLLIRFAHAPISQDFLIYAPDEVERLGEIIQPCHCPCLKRRNSTL